MSDVERNIAKPAYWWSTVLASTRDHDTTATMWDRLKTIARDQGVTFGPGIVPAISRMRATAAGIVYAQETLAKARPGDAITSKMVGLAPYARTGGARENVSGYHVYVEYNPDTVGEGMPAYGVLSYTGSLPATVDELYDAADLMAESADYGDQTPTVASVAIWAY